MRKSLKSVFAGVVADSFVLTPVAALAADSASDYWACSPSGAVPYATFNGWKFQSWSNGSSYVWCTSYPTVSSVSLTVRTSGDINALSSWCRQ